MTLRDLDNGTPLCLADRSQWPEWTKHPMPPKTNDDEQASEHLEQSSILDRVRSAANG